VSGGAKLDFIPASDLPDYKPPFFAGSTRADRDGNLWIRTIAGVAGGPVYDVVNRKGELIDRVQVPADHTILGFGPNGTVYLLNRATGAPTGTLEVATIR
jgi:sugar lactone lactonase YvrE